MLPPGLLCQFPLNQSCPPTMPSLFWREAEILFLELHHPHASRSFLTEFSTADSCVAPRVPSEVENPVSKITFDTVTTYMVRDNG